MHPILTEPTRIDNLKAWFAVRRVTQAELARMMGMSELHLNKLINRDYATPQRVEQLRTLGVPEDLLPEARERRPGRKPRTKPTD